MLIAMPSTCLCFHCDSLTLDFEALRHHVDKRASKSVRHPPTVHTTGRQKRALSQSQVFARRGKKEMQSKGTAWIRVITQL